MQELFPKVYISLTLEHNPHRGGYQSVEEFSEVMDMADEWVSEEQRQLAIRTSDFWVLQWYPITPIGFHRLAAHDLDLLLAHAREDT